jgi:hypothetical protein
MTKEYPLLEKGMLENVADTLSFAKNAEHLSHKACQTIFEFMAKAKADHLKRERLIHKVIEDFEHLFSKGSVSEP